MPGRYEIVDEPEAMEVVDDDVYHPDLTVRGGGSSTSARSLEPIIAGPIGLKTIFYDPRWSNRQRKCCIGVVVTISLCCFAILISLVVGLSKVISYINQNERMKLSGLYVIPHILEYEAGVFVYNNPSTENEPRFKELANAYIKEIDDFLAKNYNFSGDPRYVDCAPGSVPGKNKLCKFNLQTLGTNCTSENKYGYYEGKPCFLFSVRNVRKWVPNITKEFLASTEVRKNVVKGRQLDEKYLPITCNAALTPGYPPTVGYGMDHFQFYPEQGFDVTFLQSTPDLEEEKQLAPLVFVQMVKPTEFSELHVSCKLLAMNIKDLSGLRNVEFEFNNGNGDSIVDSV